MQTSRVCRALEGDIRGYRGYKYEGPDKQKVIARLENLYRKQGMETPRTSAPAPRALTCRDGTAAISDCSDIGYFCSYSYDLSYDLG